jgi:hypothetical protein
MLASGLYARRAAVTSGRARRYETAAVMHGCRSAAATAADLSSSVGAAADDRCIGRNTTTLLLPTSDTKI